MKPSRRGPVTAVRQFLQDEAAGGTLLMLAAAAAMVAANSALSHDYFAIFATKVGGHSVLHWINDALMAVFFLLVGLELKRELTDGELSTTARRVLPGAAALAGMLVPALVFIALNRDTPANLRGWAIPAATDIAFALGVLALLGRRIPASLKLLITAIAIIDDLGAIVVIAVAYTERIDLAALAAAAGGLAVLVAFNRARVAALWPYLIVGAGVWYAVSLSGVHATLAGVAVAFTLPLTVTKGTPEDRTSPLLRLEHALSPLVALVIVPLFGLANAGIDLRGVSLAGVLDPLPLGIAAGLVVGKQAGVFGTIWLFVRLRLADRPADAIVAADLGASVAVRHRLHDEPVHRRAGVWRRIARRCGETRHSRWLASRRVGGGGAPRHRSSWRQTMSFIKRYVRFVLFFATALIAGGIATVWLELIPAALVGFDLGAIVFMLALAWSLGRDAAEAMRQRAAENEPDQHVLLTVGLVVAAAVIVAVGYETMSMSGRGVILSIATLVISWMFANVLFALHYAHSWYLDDGSGGDTRGLDFPGDDEPRYWDFVYFAFVLGMTFQVSDVSITATGLRRIALAQSLVAFWFNIGVLALSVSVIGNMLH